MSKKYYKSPFELAPRIIRDEVICSVLRIENSQLDGIELEVVEFLEKIGANIIAYEFSLPELNDRFSRYFRGARSFVLDGVGTEFERDSIEHEGNIIWGRILKLSVSELGGVAEILFGRSRIFITTEPLNDGGYVSLRRIFERLTCESIIDGIRGDLSRVIGLFFENNQNIVGAGFGSEDYGGYFFDFFVHD